MITKRTILMLSAVTTFAVSSMAAAQPSGGGRFAKLDANSDGAVTLQEFESGALARFAKTDANNDGKVTPEERKAAFEAFKAAHAAKRAERGERTDKGPRGERGERGPRGEKGPRGERPNANTTFTKADVSAKMKELFAKLDKNSDGKLTEDEMKFGKHGGRGHHGPRGERGAQRS